jgi:hypothetical protein
MHRISIQRRTDKKLTKVRGENFELLLDGNRGGREDEGYGLFQR